MQSNKHHMRRLTEDDDPGDDDLGDGGYSQRSEPNRTRDPDKKHHHRRLSRDADNPGDGRRPLRASSKDEEQDDARNLYSSRGLIEGEDNTPVNSICS